MDIEESELKQLSWGVVDMAKVYAMDLSYDKCVEVLSTLDINAWIVTNGVCFRLLEMMQEKAEAEQVLVPNDYVFCGWNKDNDESLITKYLGDAKEKAFNDIADTAKTMFESLSETKDDSKTDRHFTPIKTKNHYQRGDIECKEVIKDCPFYMGSVFKYLWRYKYKNGVEDLSKALTYLNFIKSDMVRLGHSRYSYEINSIDECHQYFEAQDNYVIKAIVYHLLFNVHFVEDFQLDGVIKMLSDYILSYEK